LVCRVFLYGSGLEKFFYYKVVSSFVVGPFQAYFAIPMAGIGCNRSFDK
jgi:hypothetical protein